MTLPNVDVAFRPLGHVDVTKAFDSVGDAAVRHAQRMAGATKVVGAAIDLEIAKLKELRAARGDIARAIGGGAAGRSRAIGSVSGTGGGERVRVRDESRERKQLYRDAERIEKDAARARHKEASDADRAKTKLAKSQAADVAAEFEVMKGAFGYLRSGVDLAADALKAFGGFLIKDVVGPQIELGLRSQQIANGLQGISGDQIRTQINAFGASFAHIPSKEIEEAFSDVVYETKDFAVAQKVMSKSLQIAQAYGLGVKNVAGVLTDKRSTFSGMSEKDFEGYTAALVGKVQGLGEKKFSDFAKVSNDVERLTEMFAGNTDNQKSANSIAITGLLAASTSGTERSVSSNLRGLETLMRDLDKNLPEMARAKGTTQLARLDSTLPAILKSVGGDLTKLDSKISGGGSLGELHLGKMNRKSIDFLKYLGLDKTYREGEAANKGGGEEAVRKKLVDMMTGEYDVRKIATDEEKVRATAGYKVEESMVRLKTAFYGLVPAIEKQIIPLLKELTPKIEEVITDLVAALKDVDLIAAVKGLAQMIAIAGYELIDVLPEASLSKSQKALKQTLYRASGREAEGRAGDEFLHVDPLDPTYWGYDWGVGSAGRKPGGPAMSGGKDYAAFFGRGGAAGFLGTDETTARVGSMDTSPGTDMIREGRAGAFGTDENNTTATEENTKALADHTGALKANTDAILTGGMNTPDRGRSIFDRMGLTF